MARTTDELTDADLAFLEERHLGTLTTLRGDDALPHVVAIAFTFDPETGTASVICSDGTQKVRNVETHGRAVLCQVDGPRWMALEGTARVVRDEASVARAVAAFERRYRPARENPRRVALEVDVERILGRS